MKTNTLGNIIASVWMLFPVAAAADAVAPPPILSADKIMEMNPEDIKDHLKAELGYGVEKWREMAEQMTPTQQYAIAELYLSAEVTGDVLKDREEAMFWLLKSAHRGLPAAQYCLGTWCNMPTSIFELGHLITQTPEEAFRWFKLAADANFAPAFGALGDAYKHGRGCEKNLEAAKYWLKRAVLERRSYYALEALAPLIDDEELDNILQALQNEQ